MLKQLLEFARKHKIKKRFIAELIGVHPVSLNGAENKDLFILNRRFIKKPLYTHRVEDENFIYEVKLENKNMK